MIRPLLAHALAAELLRDAAEEFSNHGCNDWSFPSAWTDAEREDFVRAYHEWNGDPEEFNPKFLRLPDYAVMEFCAFLLDGKSTLRTRT